MINLHFLFKTQILSLLIYNYYDNIALKNDNNDIDDDDDDDDDKKNHNRPLATILLRIN